MTSLLALWTGLFMVADAPVKGVSITPAAEQTEVLISMEGVPEYRDFTMEGPHRLVVDLMGARHALPQRNFPGIDRGGVRAVRTSQYSDEIVRVVVELDRNASYQVQEGEGFLRILLESSTGSFEPWSSQVYADAGVDAPERDVAGGGSTTASQRASGSERGGNGTSARSGNEGGILRFNLQEPAQRITLSFTGTPIENVLFTFAEFSGRSIVPGSEVSGQVTADIRDQPWDVALRSILQARGLVAQETEEGIIRVDNLANLAEREQVEAVVTRPFRINYATASELQQSIQPLLSERGRISVGSGTNTVVVTDLPRIVEDVETLIEQLDVRTPQVQIQAKIIFVNRTDLNEFGVVYDLKDSRGNQLNILNPGGRDLDGDGQIRLPEEEVEVGENVVSLGGSSVAALGNANQTLGRPSLLALTSLVIGRHTLLGFVQALSELNMSEIEAAPTLTVMDNQLGRVQVGQRTPLRVVEAGGQAGDGVIPQTTVQFQETGVILEVTPHITADENILLELHAERSDAELAASDAGFIFNTQEADSRVLVSDGETVVIGGLTVTEETETTSGIPLLMDIPLLGRLFQVRRSQREQQDLMILVTPHIVRENLN